MRLFVYKIIIKAEYIPTPLALYAYDCLQVVTLTGKGKS